MIVLKFGGTSVGSGERILRVAEIALSHHDRQPVIVTSAMSGITDGLLSLADVAAQGDGEECDRRFVALSARHHDAARLIDSEGDWLDLAVNFAALRSAIDEACASKDASQLTRDLIASFGERLAVVLVSHAIRRAPNRIELVNGWYVSEPERQGVVRPMIITDDHFGEATPDLTLTHELFDGLPSDNDDILVVPGFIGMTIDGRATTLGRGGSDYAATVVAAAANADTCWIYTDVDGVFTADPRVVPEAEALPVVSFATAGRLAMCGAKVLHPRSVAPAARYGFELRVVNSFHPERSGTVIEAPSEVTRGRPQAVAGRRKLTALGLVGLGLPEIQNLFGRMCQAVTAVGAEIVLAAHPVPGHDPQVIVDDIFVAPAQERLNAEFAAEISQGKIAQITAQTSLALCAVVGDELGPGVVAQVLRALAGERIMPLSQSASPDALIFVMNADVLDRSIRRIHRDVIAPALREAERQHVRPYASGQWAAGGKPQQRRRTTLPEH